MTNQTIFDAYSTFQASNPNLNKSVLRSVIHKYLIKPWGGEAPKGSKATSEEIFNFVELLKKLPVTLLIDSLKLLEQEFEKRKVPKENSKSYRSAYKTFLEWVKNNNYFEIEKIIEEGSTPTNLFKRNLKGSGTKHKTSHHNKSFKSAFSLMAHHSGLGKNQSKLIYSEDYINDTLANELKLFKKFRVEEHGCSETTIKMDIQNIYRILGWLHRYKNISLENLRLTSIITFIKLNLSLKEFKDEKGKTNYEEFNNQKAITRENAIEVANENKYLIREYLDFLGGHPRTKIIFLNTCIALAKFIFRTELNTDEYIDETDLIIFRRLVQLSQQYNKIAKRTPDSVPHSQKSVPWENAIDVLQILRLKADYFYREVKEEYKTKSGESRYRLRKVPRSIEAVNNDLQDFLSLALMLLIPTDRARTYYELKLGKTLVCGILKHGVFTPIDKIQNKEEAVWYIHLLPDDYKTGSIYKEYWGQISNVYFEKDKTLYDYIDKWITEGRESKQKCNHDYFFRGSTNYKSLNHTAWGSRIRGIFCVETGIPVTPKEIRKMFVTYLHNSKADDATRKAAAYAMHHSQQMQEKVYNSQTILERIQPIYEYNEKMHQEFFGSSDN